jgi:hypothetical protein
MYFSKKDTDIICSLVFFRSFDIVPEPVIVPNVIPVEPKVKLKLELVTPVIEALKVKVSSVDVPVELFAATEFNVTGINAAVAIPALTFGAPAA